MVNRRHRQSELGRIISYHDKDLRVCDRHIEFVECDQEITDAEHDRAKCTNKLG